MLPGGSDALTDAAIIKRLKMQLDNGSSHLFQARLPDQDFIAPQVELRPAAVLVPLLRMEDHWSLLFTRRTETVNSHKGQVSFPGGAADPEDQSPEATALREAFEEIGLLSDDVRIFGRLRSHPTVSSFRITPVVAKIRWPLEFHISPYEVSRLFTIPLDWLADPANREERPRTVPGGYYETVIYYRPFDGEILWGITARITLDLITTLQLAP